MTGIILTGLLLLPRIIFSNSYCQVTEYVDHYEAVCEGKKMDGPITAGTRIKTDLIEASKKYEASRRHSSAVTGTGTGTGTSSAVAVNNSANDNDQVVKKPSVHREGRPDKAAMDAAIAARKQLILSRRNNGPGSQTGQIQAYPIMQQMVR